MWSGKYKRTLDKAKYCSLSAVPCRYAHTQDENDHRRLTTIQKLQIGNISRRIDIAPSSLRHEVYEAGLDDMTFAGLVTHTMKSRQNTEVMAGVDRATERLKASMAAHAMVKDSNK